MTGYGDVGEGAVIAGGDQAQPSVRQMPAVHALATIFFNTGVTPQLIEVARDRIGLQIEQDSQFVGGEERMFVEQGEQFHMALREAQAEQGDEFLMLVS